MYEVYNRPVVHPTLWDASRSRNGSFIPLGRKRLKERGVKPSTTLGVTTMNTLTLIKNQIERAAALHDAQIHVTKYRGVDCQVHQATEETHGTYCYRGRTYVK